MRASSLTSVISTKISAAPPIARAPRWTMCQSLGNPSSAEYWHIGETATRFQSTRSRSRHGGLRGLPAGGGRPRFQAHARLLRRAPREPAIHLRHEPGVAEPQVLVRDAEAAGEERERELDRVQIHVALGVFEPLEARLRRAL